MNTVEYKDEQEYYGDLKDSQPRKNRKHNYHPTLDRSMTESYKVSM